MEPETAAEKARDRGRAEAGAAEPRKRDHEPFEAVYSAADRDVAADGGPAARRPFRLQTASRVGAARGGLPDDPGDYVLSRRQPGRDGVRRYGTARTPIRPGAGPQSDDVGELRGELAHPLAVRPRPRYRHRRAAGAGRHQLFGKLPSPRSAQSADLQ